MRRLLSSRRQREREGMFVCEGEDLVAAAEGAGIEPVELLVAGETVEPALLAEVSTLAHPPRVVGIFRRADLPVGRRDATLALWHVNDPGNVGTLLRAADAFGAGVALSAGCADPTGPKALRASAGAVFRVPLSRFEPPAAADVEAPRVALVSHGGEPLPSVELGPRVTFVLGAERRGLPDDVVAACDRRATIPQPGEAESLNVAMAGTVALYEWARRAAVDESARSRNT
ncbi:MAG TPA: RNA methyltransferase [Gaiellaceae bacterium]|nr:RNA methyltransferase [Gaiellaceae bacterium]